MPRIAQLMVRGAAHHPALAPAAAGCATPARLEGERVSTTTTGRRSGAAARRRAPRPPTPGHGRPGHTGGRAEARRRTSPGREPWRPRVSHTGRKGRGAAGRRGPGARPTSSRRSCPATSRQQHPAAARPVGTVGTEVATPGPRPRVTLRYGLVRAARPEAVVTATGAADQYRHGTQCGFRLRLLIWALDSALLMAPPRDNHASLGSQLSDAAARRPPRPASAIRRGSSIRQCRRSTRIHQRRSRDFPRR